MGLFTQLMLVIGAGLIIWYLVHIIRTRPDLFSKEMFSQSFYTMGILALLLIAFISVCIWILRAS